MSRQEDLKFFEAYLNELQRDYEIMQELTPQDFGPTLEDPFKTPEDAERRARLADRYGFDGNLFRNLFPDSKGPPDPSRFAREIARQVRMIPRIIAKIDASSGARYLGDGRVEIDGCDRPVLVTNATQRRVLELLVVYRIMTTPELVHHCSNPSDTIRRLCELDDGALEPFIKRPDKKNDGYSTTIIDARPTGNSGPTA